MSAGSAGEGVEGVVEFVHEDKAERGGVGAEVARRLLEHALPPADERRVRATAVGEMPHLDRHRDPDEHAQALPRRLVQEGGVRAAGAVGGGADDAALDREDARQHRVHSHRVEPVRGDGLQVCTAGTAPPCDRGARAPEGAPREVRRFGRRVPEDVAKAAHVLGVPGVEELRRPRAPNLGRRIADPVQHVGRAVPLEDPAAGGVAHGAPRRRAGGAGQHG